MIEKIKHHWLFILLILVLGLYLSAKAIPENSWDGWSFGSAQTLLSLKQWQKEGFAKNYLLELPQGYSKTVRYFDDPQLRQHTRGLATGGFVGKRLYYTHYPPGFLVFPALLMKARVENRFWFRFLEILFSLGGLVFLYWFFSRISNKLTAFCAILYYSISILFLNYADSLTSQPFEEFLRLAIIALSVLILNNSGKKVFNYLIWILYAILAFSSYDATFFIFAWLVGLDLIIRKKIDFKKWIFWASAPIFAFLLQILQNTAYLGWHDMLLDFFGAFKAEVIGSRKNFFFSHLSRLTEPFDWFFGVKWYLGILISLIGLIAIKFIKKYFQNILDIRFLYLGLFALSFNFLFFPSLFFYQSRIISIFGGLLAGSLTVLSIKALFRRELALKLKIIFIIILIMTSGLWLIQAKRTYTYLRQWPNNIWPAEKIDFDRKIKNLIVGDKVIFEMLGTNREITGPDRYPPAVPEDEYYTEAPILGFTRVNDLIRDFNYLKKQSEFPFGVIIIADKKEIMADIQKNLKTENPISKIDDKFILIIN